ncbi:MAG: type IV secretion system DNA-binding domain-containing protein [Bacteroidales bacterium]|nr:type IV secretion system DNA-binding domain-containing protein [Bacteroidales bacterium]
MSKLINKYSTLAADELEEHFSQFLIDSWSYSGVATFARNEKEFERRYIYREPSRKSPTTVAGTAYHAALELFFNAMSQGQVMDITALQELAYNIIDQVEANQWKLGKKTPAVQDCITAATKTANALIANFCKEQNIYTDGLERIVAVEQRLEGWLIVNGVDIPLPCHAQIDLVLELADGRRVIVDHKSKSTYTDEAELAYTGAKQAIVYALMWECHHPDMPVDEVWYMENKHSLNKDGSPQLRKMAIKLDPDTRRLYEAILFEPLRRMIQATSDPNYLYTINDADPMADRAELYDFWARTLIADINDFLYLPEHKRQLISRRRRKVRDASAASISPKVIKSFRRNAATFISYELRDDMTDSEKIEHTLRMFNIMVKVAHSFGSFSSVSYLLEIGPGVMIKNIAQHALDIANAINVPSVRVLPELTVYEGKSYLCIEAPQRSNQVLVWDEKYQDAFRLPLGLDNFGRTIFWDIYNHSTPHMLICGATGSGKSVCIRSTIEYARLAGVRRIIVLDPKYEFVRSLNAPGIEVITDIEAIEKRMKQLVAEMQERARTGECGLTLIVFDEFADAVSSARSGKALDIYERVEVGTKRGPMGFPIPKYENRVVGREKSLEENLKMLLQKGRSLGYRIIAATQRASTKVITGDAKVNFPVQVCFRVPKAVDSKVVLDEEGAETLAGHGDGLIKSPEYFGTVRFQGFFKP